MESDQPIVKKGKGQQEVEDPSVLRQSPQGTWLDSPGEHGKPCDRTCEGLTHAIVAFSAPDNSVNAFILHDDPP